MKADPKHHVHLWCWAVYVSMANGLILLGDAEQLSACLTVLLSEEAGIPRVLLLSLLGHAHLNLCGAERFMNFIDYDSLSFEIFQRYCLF